MVETEIEMVQRHVRQGLEHIASQQRIIANLNGRGQIAEIARTVLASFEDLQIKHEAHLSRLIQRSR